MAAGIAKTDRMMARAYWLRSAQSLWTKPSACLSPLLPSTIMVSTSAADTSAANGTRPRARHNSICGIGERWWTTVYAACATPARRCSIEPDRTRATASICSLASLLNNHAQTSFHSSQLLHGTSLPI
jgi:hypothetical protein